VQIAFLNICHCDPQVVARVTNKLTSNKNFDMYIHVDAKYDMKPFTELLKYNDQAYFVQNRQEVFWGGYNAIKATYELLKMAYNSDKQYDYFVILQNLDYPIKSNTYIEDFFTRNKGTEFIRACQIGPTKIWHMARKYRLYNQRDDSFYLTKHSRLRKLLHDARLALQSISTIGFNGIIKENGESYPIYYGAAQWAVTRECANYFMEFEKSHPKYNQIMQHVQYPDEEYFHTIVHNSVFRERCCKYNEPEMHWLVNWRNIHYFEYLKEVTVFDKKDFEKLIQQEDLFIRKVRTGKSTELMDLIDAYTLD
jgi:hypothetical protein